MRAIAALKQPADSLTADPEVAKTAAMLPAGSPWVGYFSPSGAVAFAKWVVNAMSEEGGYKPNIPDFPASPPIGIAAKGLPGQLQIEAVVSPAVLEAIGKYVGLVQSTNTRKCRSFGVRRGLPPLSVESGCKPYFVILSRSEMRQSIPTRSASEGMSYGPRLRSGLVLFLTAQSLYSEGLSEGSPSLKESFVSRGFWRNFGCRLSATALLGRFSIVSSFCCKIADFGLTSLTVFLFEVVEPFFSSRLHPYTSLRESLRRHGGRSGPLEPDTDYSAATVSHCMAVSFRATLG